MGGSIIKKRPEEIERIVNVAQQKAAPYLKRMGEIIKLSVPVWATIKDGECKIVWTHETNQNFLNLKQAVEDIFKEAEREINS